MPNITLTIASRLDAVPLLGQLVSLIGTSAGLTPLEANEVEVCVVEVVNNSIKHAYQQDPGQQVALDVTLLDRELVFEVWDSGISADPSSIHKDHLEAFDLDLEHPEDFSESGRGLAIIQQVMDSFVYTAGAERNCFRLTKCLKHA